MVASNYSSCIISGSWHWAFARGDSRHIQNLDSSNLISGGPGAWPPAIYELRLRIQMKEGMTHMIKTLSRSASAACMSILAVFRPGGRHMRRVAVGLVAVMLMTAFVGALDRVTIRLTN